MKAEHGDAVTRMTNDVVFKVVDFVLVRHFVLRFDEIFGSSRGFFGHPFVVLHGNVLDLECKVFLGDHGLKRVKGQGIMIQQLFEAGSVTAPGNIISYPRNLLITRIYMVIGSSPSAESSRE